MGTASTADSPVNGLGVASSGVSEVPTSQHGHPLQSAIRGLRGAGDGFDFTGPELRNQTIAPPPMTLDAAAEHYGRLTSGNPAVIHALQAGDLPQAIVTLIQENFMLRKQNASWQSDFEELRSVNVAQQEQMDERLAVVDEERVQLLEQLERARSELIELESQGEQARRDYEDDLEALRQQRDALQHEIFELKTS